jgi:hypothetical protein
MKDPSSISKERRFNMNSVTLIQIVSGVLFVIVLGVLIRRRRSKA